MATAEQNKTEKRVRLLDSALSLFSSKGMKPPTVDEVVKLAGVAKGTFYLYFRDKYDLMDQLVLKKLAECIKGASEAVSRKFEGKDVTDVEHLCVFLDTVLDSLAENKEFLPLIKDRIGTCYRLMLRDQEHLLREDYNKLVGIFVNHGYTTRESEMHIYMLTTMIASVCCEAAITSEPYSIDELKSGVRSIAASLLA